MAITPSLLIKTVKLSGTAPGSQLKLTVQVLPELYLETITLAKGDSGLVATGKLTKGSVRLPGGADAVISAELYDFIVTESKTSTLAIELDYTGKSVIRNIFVEYV